MKYADYFDRFRAHRAFAELSVYGTVREEDRDYPLLCAVTPGRAELVITSGFHGEEPAGPLTLLEHLPEIARYAARRDVALRIYPCVNPSGFEAGTRYNRSGEKPNNDFLRYEVQPGVWKGELKAGEAFLRWQLFDGGPKETRLIRAELERHPAPAAALDIHQDDFLQGARTYAYTFGDPAPYASLMSACAAVVPVASSQKVDVDTYTDPHGLIPFHDGSVTDYYLRRGVPYTATLETTTRTPLADCHEVNLIWIMGFIDLAARPQADQPGV